MMNKQFFSILIILLAVQFNTWAQSGPSLDLKQWTANPTADVEIRYHTLTSDSTVYQGDYQVFYQGKPQIVGTYLENFKHGQWRRLYANGTINMRAYFDKGYKHGQWSYFYPNGQLASSASYNYDYPIGTWKGYSPDGTLIKEIVYISDSVINYETSFHANGEKAEQTVYSYGATDKYEVTRKYYLKGQLFTESYKKNGELDSVYRKFYPDGKPWEEFLYKEGKLMQVKVLNDMDGAPATKGTFKDGSGTLTRYHNDGKMFSQELYKNGMKSGAAMYYSEGKLREGGFYTNNERSGVWTFYDNKKKKTKTCEYFLGKDSVFVSQYHEKGIRIATFTYVNGLLNGPYVAYTFRGDTLRTFQYVEGYKHGTAKIYQAGKMTEAGTYLYGEKDGDWNYYGANGKIYLTEEYKSQASHTKSSFKQKRLYINRQPSSAYPYSDKKRIAQFPGGASEEERYVTNNMLYPAWASEKNIHGDVIVELTISELGEVIDILIVKGIGYHCDEEAIALFTAIPFWEPAMRNGMPYTSKILRTLNF